MGTGIAISTYRKPLSGFLQGTAGHSKSTVLYQQMMTVGQGNLPLHMEFFSLFFWGGGVSIARTLLPLTFFFFFFLYLQLGPYLYQEPGS